MRRDVSAETSTAPWSTSSVVAGQTFALPPRSASAPPRAAPPGSDRRRIRDPGPRSAPPRPAAQARRPAAVPASPRPPLARPSAHARASRNSRSAAASSARWTTAPTSGVRRPRITTMPSSSTQVDSCRCRCRDSACAAAATSIHPPPGPDQAFRWRRFRPGRSPAATLRCPAWRRASALAPWRRRSRRAASWR